MRSLSLAARWRRRRRAACGGPEATRLPASCRSATCDPELSWPSATNDSRSSEPSDSSVRTTATWVSVRPPFSPRRTTELKSSSVSATSTSIGSAPSGAAGRSIDSRTAAPRARASTRSGRWGRAAAAAHDASNRRLVAAVELVAAVNDHLRRVEATLAEDLRVRLLAAGERFRGERILPTLVVPVGRRAARAERSRRRRPAARAAAA